MYGRQTAPGVPGSFPLPIAGQAGNTYNANKLHPAAAAGLGRGLANGGRPAPGGKR